MKTIPLTNSDQVALVDDEDYEYLIQWNWQYNGGYAQRHDRSDGNNKTLYMHTAITSYAVTDHIDKNRLNNQRYNLRCATNSGNAANRKIATKRANITSQFKGVHWHTKANKWRARIVHSNKTYHLGLFISELDAALAYNEAATKYFGEFASLNNIKESE